MAVGGWPETDDRQRDDDDERRGSRQEHGDPDAHHSICEVLLRAAPRLHDGETHITTNCSLARKPGEHTRNSGASPGSAGDASRHAKGGSGKTRAGTLRGRGSLALAHVISGGRRQGGTGTMRGCDNNLVRARGFSRRSGSPSRTALLLPGGCDAAGHDRPLASRWLSRTRFRCLPAGHPRSDHVERMPLLSRTVRRTVRAARSVPTGNDLEPAARRLLGGPARSLGAQAGGSASLPQLFDAITLRDTTSGRRLRRFWPVLR